MTWGAVNESMQHVSQRVDKHARAKELDRVYGIDFKTFQFRWQAKGAMVNAISWKSLKVRAGGRIGITPLQTEAPDAYKSRKVAYGTTASKAPAEDPPARASSSGRKKEWVAKASVVTAQAAPAAVATAARVVTSQDAPAKAKAPAPKAEAPAPKAKAKAAPAVPALGARAQRTALCEHLNNDKMHRMRKAAIRNGYFSHTDRWRRQPGYADTCRAKVPPDPEWLVYADGTTARIDGERGDAFPPGR